MGNLHSQLDLQGQRVESVTKWNRHGQVAATLHMAQDLATNSNFIEAFFAVIIA